MKLLRWDIVLESRKFVKEVAQGIFSCYCVFFIGAPKLYTDFPITGVTLLEHIPILFPYVPYGFEYREMLH